MEALDRKAIRNKIAARVRNKVCLFFCWVCFFPSKSNWRTSSLIQKWLQSLRTSFIFLYIICIYYQGAVEIKTHTITNSLSFSSSIHTLIYLYQNSVYMSVMQLVCCSPSFCFFSNSISTFCQTDQNRFGQDQDSSSTKSNYSSSSKSEKSDNICSFWN